MAGSSNPACRTCVARLVSLSLRSSSPSLTASVTSHVRPRLGRTASTYAYVDAPVIGNVTAQAVGHANAAVVQLGCRAFSTSRCTPAQPLDSPPIEGWHRPPPLPDASSASPSPSTASSAPASASPPPSRKAGPSSSSPSTTSSSSSTARASASAYASAAASASSKSSLSPFAARGRRFTDDDGDGDDYGDGGVGGNFEPFSATSPGPRFGKAGLSAWSFADEYVPTAADFMSSQPASSPSVSGSNGLRGASRKSATEARTAGDAGRGMKPPGDALAAYRAQLHGSGAGGKSARRRRRTKRSVLPPLPAGEMPPDGRTRFDWRLWKGTTMSPSPSSRSSPSPSSDAKRSPSSSTADIRQSSKTILNGQDGGAEVEDGEAPLQLQQQQQRRDGMEDGKGDVVGEDDVEWWPELQGVQRVGAPPGVLQVGDPYYEETARYSDHFVPLLLLEQDEEKRVFEERLRDSSVHKLCREGLALDAMTATVQRSNPPWTKSQIVRFVKHGGRYRDLGFHRFISGASVILSRTDPCSDAVLKEGQTAQGPSAHDERLSGRVIHAGRDYIRVHFPISISRIEVGEWRLDLGLNDWALQAQLKSIRALDSDPLLQDMSDFESDVSGPPSSASRRPREETILHGTALRDRVLRAFQEDYIPYDASADSGNASIHSIRESKPDDIDAVPTPSPHTDPGPSGILAKNQLIQSWTQRYRGDRGGDVVRVEGDPPLRLNDSQMKAIAMMLSERLSLVQGPPGTGKTRVIIETIKLLKLHWQVPFPILVCAHTNVAVDNLLSGLREGGVSAVRVGLPDRIGRDLVKYSLDPLAMQHPLYQEIVQLNSEAAAITEQLDEFFQTPLRSSRRMNEMRTLVLKRKELQKKGAGKRALLYRGILNDADVICTTCLSASTTALRQIDFPMVFLDEASMATEPLSIMPLMRGSSHVAIIGDHKQLPPVIVSPEAQAGGLAISLFERLIHERHVPSIMLDTQYRMHPTISAFPSAAFYNDDLKDGTVDPSTGEVRAGLEPPKSVALNEGQSVGFVDHDYPENKDGKSLANQGDVRLVMEIVEDLLLRNPNLKGEQIGIISPYAAQIRSLSEGLQRMLLSDRTRGRLGFERTSEIAEIEVKTVDGFEGREKEVIVLSTVRSNPSGHIGFLGDWRRLNVGLTRARRGLVVVGNSETLEKARHGQSLESALPSGGGEVWRAFMRWLRDSNLVKEAEREEIESASVQAESEWAEQDVQEQDVQAGQSGQDMQAEQDGRDGQAAQDVQDARDVQDGQDGQDEVALDGDVETWDGELETQQVDVEGMDEEERRVKIAARA